MNEQLSPSADDKPFEPKGSPLPVRGDSAVIPDNRWYNLKFKFFDTDKKIRDGHAYYVGTDPTWQYWDYISATPSNGPLAKFKKDSTRDGWMQLKTSDGYFLSCRAAPRLWLYRSSQYPIGWNISDKKLYTNYHSGAVGAAYHGVVVPDAYYMCVDGTPPLFDCEWVLADPQ